MTYRATYRDPWVAQVGGINEIMGPCDVTCDVTSDVTSTRTLFQRVFGRFGARQWPQGYGFGYENNGLGALFGAGTIVNEG